MANSFSDEIFEPAFVFEGPHLVEASAGTGKTYNIQNIYARLVIEKGLRVAEIQVMTFTEAATKELRDRVRKVMAGMSDLYAGNTGYMMPPELERCEKIRACARANLDGDESAADAEARRRISRALMEFDQAAISTIHGFCGRVLKKFAFETGGNFYSEFQDNKAADIAQKVRDWWRNARADAPACVCDGLNLTELGNDAGELSKKADWRVDTAVSQGPSEWMLNKAAEFVDDYESERVTREAQTFDDLLRAVREALLDKERGKDLARRLRNEFKAALIDEFQDTDPVQYDIFRLVFLSGEALAEGILFFVGDPKQAIYSFRGGDIFAYKRAATGTEVRDHVFRLEQNRRSTPRLVQAVNSIFRDASDSHTFGDASIGYPEDLKWSEIPALNLADGQDDPTPFRIIAAHSIGDSNSCVVQEVLDVLREQEKAGLGPRDIAILVSSHASARRFREALKKVGVHAVLQKSGNVFSGTAASDLRQVMLAMARMGGVGQMRTALATSFFETPVADIVDESKFAERVAMFNELNKVWTTKGFEAAFTALADKSGFRGKMALRSDGERMLTDIFQILDLASEATKKIGPSPDALVSWITERLNASGEHCSEEDAEEYARQIESETDALKIMTVHASKGLQFPVVIVPLTGPKSVRPPYFHHGEDSHLYVGLSDEAAAAAQEELNQEQTRLYYVAFTRAKQRTIVITTHPEEGTPLARLFANARANGAGEDVADSPIRWIQDPKIIENPAPYEPDDGTANELSAALTPRAYSRVPTQGSYSTLAPTHRSGDSTGHDVDADKSVSEIEVSADEHPIFTLRGGAKTGTCWHEILEKAPFNIDDTELLARVKDSLRVHGCASKDEACACLEADLVAEMMRKTLSSPLTSPAGKRFSLCDIDLRNRISEWEFDFSSVASAARTGELAAILRDEWSGDESKRPFLDALDGWDRYIPKGFFIGFLDLVFRHDGYYYVVDWKSNGLNRRKSGFSAAGITREMADEGYFFQYLLYSVVLRKYLKETLGDGYSWEKNFGGVCYYFLRGIAADAEAAVFADRPSERLLVRLSAALGLEDK